VPCAHFYSFDLLVNLSFSSDGTFSHLDQCYTVEQVIEFVYDLTQRLDNAEFLLLSKGRGEMDENDWIWYHHENSDDPTGVLEEFRSCIVRNCWRAAIEKNISNPMDRFPYVSEGVFDYKAPSAVLAAGRAKA